MNLYENTLYLKDIENTARLDLPWEKLRGKKIFLTGATGLIGSFLTDVLMEKNRSCGLDCTVYALGRNEERARKRFYPHWNGGHLVFIPYDVNTPLIRDDIGTADDVLHLASNTHPLQYAADPIGTITANVTGLWNMLEFAAEHGAERFVFASSNEIYGENRGDVEFFDESYCGYIDPNTLRAGYPESKRCGEALCQAYRTQKGVDCVIARFTRSYGPTMLESDSKAVSQFIRRAAVGEDIVLKSEGRQYYSYTYVADAVSGLLTVLLKGEDGEVYNIADESSDIMLKDLAEMAAEISGGKVVHEAPDAVENAGYSRATKARLDGHKLKGLGWRPGYDIRRGIERTVKILRSLEDRE